MKEVTVTKYVTLDGKEFFDETEAKLHEEKMAQKADDLIENSPNFSMTEIDCNSSLWNLIHATYIIFIENDTGVEEVNFVCKMKQINDAGEPLEFKRPGKFIVIANEDMYYQKIREVDAFVEVINILNNFDTAKGSDTVEE